MFNSHSELNAFFANCVRLGKGKAVLRDYRDCNIDRLKDGLKALDYKLPVRTCNQGSYAMNSLNQRPENNSDLDYDIDVAIIFKKEDLPESPLDARQRVLEGILEGGGNFRRTPEVRTNAVTVWYQEKYHVDLAVYRTYTNSFGLENIEHAGIVWVSRNPAQITTWFNDTVSRLSPKSDLGATVEPGQMSRVVRLLKYFARSRASWDLPGGFIITALAATQYIADYYRDDIALYKTMQSIHNYLCYTSDVTNPVEPLQLLTYKDKYRSQVCRLKDKLADALEWLNPLFSSECDSIEAAKTWNKIFHHSYWASLAEQEEAKAQGEALRRAGLVNSLYVTSSGKVLTQKPEEKAINIPAHRFYGEE